MAWTKELFLAKLQCKHCGWKNETWFEGRDTSRWLIPECCSEQVGATNVTAYFEDENGRRVEASSQDGVPALVASRH